MRSGQVGGGVAREQIGCLSASVHEEADDEDRERLRFGPDGGDESADDGEEVAESQSVTAPTLRHEAREVLRHERGADGDGGGGDTTPRGVLAENALDDERAHGDGRRECGGCGQLAEDQDAQGPALDGDDVDDVQPARLRAKRRAFS